MSNTFLLNIVRSPGLAAAGPDLPDPVGGGGEGGADNWV